MSFLALNFEALVQSQEDFIGELEHLRLESLGLPLTIEVPSDEVVAARLKSEISDRLTEKLSRAFPDAAPSVIEMRVSSHVRARWTRYA